MGNYFLVTPVLPYHHSAGAAFGTFTTKKSVDALPVPVIKADSLQRGSKLYMRAVGEFSTTGTPNITLGFWFGTRTLTITGDVALSGVIATGSGAAAWPWEMWWLGHLDTDPGTNASLVGSGVLMLGTSLTAFATSAIPVTAALRTVTGFDTTIERAIGVSGTWGTSSGSNTIKVNDLMVLQCN